MRNLTVGFREEANASEQTQLFRLITLVIAEGNVLQICDSNYDVTFGGVVYSKFPVSVKDMTLSSDGTVERASVTVANVSREMEYEVETNKGLQGCRVSVKKVYAKFLDFIYTIEDDGSITTSANPLADYTAYIEDEFIIDSYKSNESVIVFDLLPVCDFVAKVPRGRFNSNTCSWRYKSPECNYSGALPTCAKTLQACREHNNSPRFGGFPGVPDDVRRIYF